MCRVISKIIDGGGVGIFWGSPERKSLTNKKGIVPDSQIGGGLRAVGLSD